MRASLGVAVADSLTLLDGVAVSSSRRVASSATLPRVARVDVAVLLAFAAVTGKCSVWVTPSSLSRVAVGVAAVLETEPFRCPGRRCRTSSGLFVVEETLAERTSGGGNDALMLDEIRGAVADRPVSETLHDSVSEARIPTAPSGPTTSRRPRGIPDSERLTFMLGVGDRDGEGPKRVHVAVPVRVSVKVASTVSVAVNVTDGFSVKSETVVEKDADSVETAPLCVLVRVFVPLDALSVRGCVRLECVLENVSVPDPDSRRGLGESVLVGRAVGDAVGVSSSDGEGEGVRMVLDCEKESVCETTGTERESEMVTRREPTENVFVISSVLELVRVRVRFAETVLVKTELVFSTVGGKEVDAVALAVADGGNTPVVVSMLESVNSDIESVGEGDGVKDADGSHDALSLLGMAVNVSDQERDAFPSVAETLLVLMEGRGFGVSVG